MRDILVGCKRKNEKQTREEQKSRRRRMNRDLLPALEIRGAERARCRTAASRSLIGETTATLIIHSNIGSTLHDVSQ